jgi:alkylation response protein AidB-like acyl-CoA dehydrogenase
MAMHVETAQLLVYQTAGTLDRHAPCAIMNDSITKYYGSDVTMRVKTNAVSCWAGWLFQETFC